MTTDPTPQEPVELKTNEAITQQGCKVTLIGRHTVELTWAYRHQDGALREYRRDQLRHPLGTARSSA